MYWCARSNQVCLLCVTTNLETRSCLVRVWLLLSHPGGVRHKFRPIGKLHLNNSLRGKEQCASEGRLLKKNLFPATSCDSCENWQSEKEDGYIYIILAALNYCLRSSCLFYELSKLMWLDRPPCCYNSEFHTFLFARRSLYWSLWAVLYGWEKSSTLCLLNFWGLPGSTPNSFGNRSRQRWRGRPNQAGPLPENRWRKLIDVDQMIPNHGSPYLV